MDACRCDSDGGSLSSNSMTENSNVAHAGSGEHSAQRWFALRVKSGTEKMVAAMARNKGFEEFVPLYQSRRRWSDRVKSVECPLFQGYVFCRLNPANRMPLLTISSVMHFVGVGRVPAPIDDCEISAIQAAVRSGLPTQPWPFLVAGQRLRLDEGPLAGLDGVLVQVRKEHRLVVSVTLLQRSLAVEIDRDWVRPLAGVGSSCTVN